MYKVFCLLGLLIAASGCAAVPAPPPQSSVNETQATPPSAISQAVVATSPAVTQAAPAPAVKHPAAVKPRVSKAMVSATVAGKQSSSQVVKTLPPSPEATPPLAQATAPVPAETMKPLIAATPTPPPAGTAMQGLTATTLAMVMDWRDYWIIDLFLVVLLLLTLALLMLLWRLPLRRDVAAYQATALSAMALVSRSPSVRSTNMIGANVNGINGTDSALFASAGITIGRGTEFGIIRFINQGQTPVTFEENCLVIGVGRVLTPIPSYPVEATEHFDSPITVNAGQQISIRRPNRVSEQNWERIKRGEDGLWLFGYINYRTQSGALYRQGFCFNYQPPTAAFSSPSNGRVAMMGPRAYTYVRAQEAYPRESIERGETNSGENLVHP